MSRSERKNKEYQWLLEEKYHGVSSQDFLDDVLKLEQGVPLAYIIGQVPFLGTNIDLSFHPLIPRAETEHWVHAVIKDMHITKSSGEDILDLCAGSGCIGIALLKHFENIHVDFIDSDKDAIKQIEKNISLNEITAHQFSILCSDLFEKCTKKYDYIFANPPYLSRGRVKNIQETVLQSEPHTALFSAEDGMSHIERILENAPRFLAPGGTLYMEHDPWQKEQIMTLLRGKFGISFHFLKDQYGDFRVTVVHKFAS